MANFWTQPSRDPKRNFKFLVSFPTMDGGMAWYAKKVDKPSFTVNEASHKYLNHTFYYPGRVEWSTINVTLVDPIDPDASANIAAILEASGYRVPGNENYTATMSKNAAANALKQVKIQQISSEINSSTDAGDYNTDNGSSVIETWTLNNCFIKSAKFGNLDYESDEITQIDLELRFDWCTLDSAAGLRGETNKGLDEFRKDGQAGTDEKKFFKGPAGS